MSRFYLKEITAIGKGRKTSSISFVDGVNIIHGPSNTGKSYLISAIDFMLGGSEAPFSLDTGYDTVCLIVCTEDNESLQITRQIVVGPKDGKEKGASTVEIISQIKGIESGTYKVKPEYDAILLRLFGIEKAPKIAATQQRKGQNFSFRSIWHFMFIDEDFIYKKGTALYAPKSPKITASIMSLLYLLTGDPHTELVLEEDTDLLKQKKLQLSGILIAQFSA